MGRIKYKDIMRNPMIHIIQLDLRNDIRTIIISSEITIIIIIKIILRDTLMDRSNSRKSRISSILMLVKDNNRIKMKTKVVIVI